MELDPEHARRLASLEARMDRMERWMQEVLVHLGIHSKGTSGINPLAVLPDEQLETQQARPEIAAIRAALLSGDKIKAIKLYRTLYGVSMKEAQDALAKL